MRIRRRRDLKMWTFACIMSVIILILCGLVILLSSCTKEVDSTGGNTSSQHSVVCFFI